MSYAKEYQRAFENPTAFWAEQAQHLDWEQPWDAVLDDRRAPCA